MSAAPSPTPDGSVVRIVRIEVSVSKNAKTENKEGHASVVRKLLVPPRRSKTRHLVATGIKDEQVKRTC